MARMKTERERMAEVGLSPYVVTYYLDGVEGLMRFWADDVPHAGEQMEDAEPDCEIMLIETQEEYETRTGESLGI